MARIQVARVATGLVSVPTRILVVDGESLTRWAICAALAAEGFDAISAADLVAAGRLAAEWPPPRVVLLDLREPDRDGLEAVSAIRCGYPDCRFVIMTTARDCATHAFTDGVELVEKPFDLARLVRLVTELAHRSTSTRAPSDEVGKAGDAA